MLSLHAEYTEHVFALAGTHIGPVFNGLQRETRNSFTYVNISWQDAGVNKNAFGKLGFSYYKELDKARLALDRQVYEYVSGFPSTPLHLLAKRLHISTGKLSEILQRFPHGRKPGRRKKQRSEQPDSNVAAPQTAVPVSHYLEREDMEHALKALNFCVVNGRADDAGEDAYQNLIDWLEKPQGNRTMRQRAGYLTQRYERLRHNPKATRG